MTRMKMERPNLQKRQNTQQLKKTGVKKQKDGITEGYTKPILQIQEQTLPIIDDYDESDYQEEQQIDSTQMSLGVEDTSYKIKQKVSGYKSFFRRRKELLEFAPNWRSPWLPLTVVFTLVNFLMLSAGLVYLYKTKKTIEVPFIYDPVDRTWFRNDIVTVFLIASSYLAISYLIVFLSGKITKFDRRLSAMINAMLFFINVLFNIGIIQIFLLIS